MGWGLGAEPDHRLAHRQSKKKKKKNPNSFKRAVKLQGFFLIPQPYGAGETVSEPTCFSEIQKTSWWQDAVYQLVAMHVRGRGFKFVGDLT